jgi:serine/threonine protein kinase
MTSIVHNTLGYAFSYSEYRHPPTNNQQIIDQVRKYLLLDGSINIAPADRNNLLIHIYEELSENEFWVPLSTDFLNFLSDRGLEILCRLGSGGSSDAFLVLHNNSVKTLLLESNRNNYGISLEESLNYLSQSASKVQEIFNIPDIDIYINRMFDIFYSDIPYSDDNTYLSISIHDFHARPIYLLEYMTHTLADLININRDKWLDSKVEFETFLNQVKLFDSQFHDFLWRHNLEYPDVKPDNIMISYGKGFSYFKYVDVQGILKRNHGNRSYSGKNTGLIVELLRRELDSSEKRTR